MKWSAQELRVFKDFIEQQKKKGIPWKTRARLWNRRFKTNRSVNSLRGVWNRIQIGWQPEWRGRRAESPVDEIEELSEPIRQVQAQPPLRNRHHPPSTEYPPAGSVSPRPGASQAPSSADEPTQTGPETPPAIREDQEMRPHRAPSAVRPPRRSSSVLEPDSLSTYLMFCR